MNEEFLQDYHMRELAAASKFVERLEKGQIEPEERFPPANSFHRLLKPSAIAATASPIWPQIPLCGSLIIPLSPRAENHFKELHGFGSSDIDSLVSFCKETGRVQFALSSDPLSFRGLDFLDPIFSELKPPRLVSPYFITEISPQVAKKFMAEFVTLSDIKFFSWYRKFLRKHGATENHVRARMKNLAGYYVFLRAKGFDAISEQIENDLIDDPPSALTLLNFSQSLLIWPSGDHTRSIRNFTLRDLVTATETTERFNLPSPRLEMPCEIGSFLLQQLTFAPNGLDACKDLVYHYSRRDLYNVMNAINEGALNKNREILKTKVSALKETFRLVWEDMELETRESIAKFLIPVTLGAIGLIFSPTAGLLGTLGFYLAEKVSEKIGDPLSERIVKRISPGYMVTIFDFKKKYGLDDQHKFREVSVS